MASTLTADEHKLKGNEYFKAKDYQDAIQEYSKAIVKNPKVAVYYCNRANCCLKLEQYSKVVSDCERVVELDPKNVKGYYFMGKARLELGQPYHALSNLKRAYELSLDQRSNFTKDIITILSEAKKQKWIEEERRRIASLSDTYKYMKDLIEQDMDRQVEALDKDAQDYDENRAFIVSDREHRLQQLEMMLGRSSVPEENARPYIQNKTTPPTPQDSPQLARNASSVSYQPREVPDYLLDKITYEFMHDPVISTKSGVTYERNTLLEHFGHGRMFDPVSQAPMTEHDMLPNRALKEACEDYLSKNGWAVDY
ncbi:STIP1 y and U box-containing protein 1 [Podila horticola]|nr:STIP1 y and U box-containing protein 1 [Podila horticola]